MSGFEDDPRAEVEDTTGYIHKRATDLIATKMGGGSSLNLGHAAMTKQQRDYKQRMEKLSVHNREEGVKNG